MGKTIDPSSDKTETSPRPAAGRRRLSGKWRKWAVIAAGLLALYAFVGFLVVPPVAKAKIIKLAAEKLHRRLTVDHVSLNPFLFKVVARGFDLRDRDGSGLLKFDRLTVDFQLSSLFRRAWTFKVIRIEGPQLVARVAADGRLSAADLFAAGNSPASPAPAPARTPRIIIGQFIMDAGRLDYKDDSRTPPFAETLAPINLEVHEFSTIPDLSGDHGLTFGLGPDTRIHWTGRQTIEPLHLEGKCEVTGLSLPLLWRYAAPAPGLELRDGRADLSWSYDVRNEPAGLSLSIADAALAARDIAVRPAAGGEDWLVVPLAEVRDIAAAFPAQTLDIGDIKITEPRITAVLEANGTTNWQAAMAGPAGASGASGSGETAAAARPASSPPPAKPWTVKIGSVEVENGAGRFDDRAAAPPVSVALSRIGVQLENLSSDLKAPISVRASARVDEAGDVSAEGTVTPGPMSADLQVAVLGLDLVPVRSYLNLFPGTEFRTGRADLKGKVRVAQGQPSLRFEGEAALAGFDLEETGTGRLLAWDLVKATGLVVTQQPVRMRAARVEFDRPFFKIHISKDGTLNLTKLTAPAETAGPATPPAPATPVDIATIAFNDATLDYTDESLILPFDTKIYATNGTLRDLSTTSAAAARLDLEGRVAQAGFFKSAGTLRISDPFASTDVAVTFRRVPMTDLTPYVAQFAGYSVKSGDLDVDVRYRVEDRHLVGENKVVMTDLTLGPKVPGAKGPGLPVRLAISLLKDKEGRINLNVPVEGTVDSPEFNYGKIFWAALKKILLSLVTAPFRAIGRLFGSSDEDLDLVGFSSGSSDLLPAEKELLAKISAELAGKPEITIEVGGRYDPQADAAAMRRSRLEARIDAKRTGTATLESILEALYAETYTAERLEAERARFQPQAAPPETRKKKGGKKQPSPPPAPLASFDAGGFYDSLRAQLLDAEAVSEDDLKALARDRAAAIVAALTAPGGLDASRVKAGDPKPVTRKKRGSDLVASEMTMSAGD